HQLVFGNEQPSNAAACERTPQLGWHEQSDHSTDCSYAERSLDEQCRKVDLSCDPHTGSCDERAGPPRCTAVTDEVSTKRRARRRRDSMDAHPRRIAYHHVEPPGARNVRKVSCE